MLTIKNLSVSINDQSIIKALNLCLEQGTVHILMGPNGSGKSSLAYTLMGHPNYMVTQGSMHYNNVDLMSMSVEDRAKRGMFLALQNPIIIPGVTVFNLLKESYAACVNATINTLDFTRMLYDAMDMVRLDYAHAYRSFNEGFSGGERKRLELVQMILLKPKLIILDEIDSGVDADGQKMIAQIVADARKENTTSSFLIITHYPHLVDSYHPDFVHIMVNGVIIHSGNASLAQTIAYKGYDEIPLQ